MRFRVPRELVALIATACICVFGLGAFMAISSWADISSKNPESNSYQLQDGTQYNRTGRASTASFAYGRKTIGSLRIESSFSQESSYKSRKAYGVFDEIRIRYSYDGSLHADDKESWKLFSDDSTVVNGYTIPKKGLIQPKVGMGMVLVQKSEDGTNWSDTAAPITDYFKKNKAVESELYKASESEIKNGQFYRITIAYRIGRKIAEKEVSGWFNSKHKEDVYEYKQCLEVYEFYVCSDKQYVTVKNLVNRNDLQKSDKTDKGFYISKNGSDNNVIVTRKSIDSVAEDYQSYADVGAYSVTITTKLGKLYRYEINVNDGLSLKNITPLVYESDKDKGFPEKDLINASTSYGKSSYTELSIGYREGTEITSSMKGNITGYGVSSDTVNLFLKLKYDVNTIGDNWSVSYDKWGSNKKQTVNGVQTGSIGKGALIIQTSSDGINWVNVENGRYANGLYTTDYGTYYASGDNVFIYSPEGNAVIHGVFIRVFYAYQAYNASQKTYRDFLEKYEFYLCSNELNAVTFHNLSTKEALEERLGELDEKTAAMYRNAETMLSGAMTVTGFSIDTSLNSTVRYVIKKDGQEIGISKDNKYTETGKYDIHLVSDVGDERNVTIYVDNRTPEEALLKYFGSSFIDGKRIYSEGKYPTFEAGETIFHLEAIKENSLPVSGRIKNLTTGKETLISATRTGIQKELTEAGQYEAEFTTFTTESGKRSGDSWKFVFHFNLIAHGEAPGPVVNKNSLTEYCQKSVSDYYPIYYGLTFSSSTKGDITLAFSNKEDAVKYAYNYESGTVEIQKDGSYRYKGSFKIAQKVKYESNWDLTDAINYFAEMAVQKFYFNLNDEFTYLTLEESSIKDINNLRKLELDKSIVVFCDNTQRINQSKATSDYPIINDKKNLYLVPGTEGKVNEIINTFKFIKDKYGCDSNTVEITDSTGKTYHIDYGTSVDQQLKKQNCPSGIITITEKTFYGDQTSYKAIYISDGDNQAALSIQVNDGKNLTTESFSNKDSGKHLEAESFSIQGFTDNLDPCSLVIVSDGQNEDFYTANTSIEKVWANPGKYTVTCVNRMGYSFSLTITVNESTNVYISFDGEGTEGIKTISAKVGDTNITLPTPTNRDGYEFIGYSDMKTGKIYTNKIDKVDFRGTLSLTAQWKKITSTDGTDNAKPTSAPIIPAGVGNVIKNVIKVIITIVIVVMIIIVSAAVIVIIGIRKNAKKKEASKENNPPVESKEPSNNADSNEKGEDDEKENI